MTNQSNVSISYPRRSATFWYGYPPYMFTNESADADIPALCGQPLDRLGMAWRYSLAQHRPGGWLSGG
jgi:hypothetical protein